MRYYSIIITLFIIISSVAATSIDNKIPLDKIPRSIIITNITINESLINSSNINITEINETNISIIPINNTNISINDSNINLTEINITNITIIHNDTNITTNSTNINISEINQSNSSLLDITGLITFEELFEENKTEEGFKEGTTVYFYAGNKLIASKKNNEIKYHHQDRLNSDINTKTLPFGQELAKTKEKFTFTGKELDNSGLYYFNARYYDANVGRFTSIDPVPSEPSYQYVHNNPINFNDPSGKQTASSKNQNTVNIDSLLVSIPQDTLQLTNAPLRNLPFGSRVILDYSNLKGPIKKGVDAFESAILNGISFAQAVASVDLVSWSSTPYDRIRTNHANRDSLEHSIYGDSPPKLSDFFDNSFPEAVCREYVGLTIAMINIIHEKYPEAFKDTQISILNLNGVRNTHRYTKTNSGKYLETIKPQRIGHSLIEITSPQRTLYISGGRVFTAQELTTLYNSPRDSTNSFTEYTRGGYNLDTPIWKHTIIDNTN